MPSNRLRVGVIGASATYGWARSSHLPALLALPDYDLVAVCTAHEDSARESATQFGVPMAFHDYRAMLADADLDVVAVSVRVPSHHRLTMDVLEAGKHVYTEWPLGANPQEAEEMAALARAKGVRTMVGLQARASPVFLRLRELVQGGYVGRVVSSRLNLFSPGVLSRTSDRTWQSDRRMGANTLTISFGHPIDGLCMCLGEFEEVSAVVATQVTRWSETDTGSTVDVDSPDNVLVAGTLEGGAVVSAHVASIPWQGSGYRLEIYGTEGTLVVAAPHHAQMGEQALLGATDADGELADLEIPKRLVWVPESVRHGAVFNVAQMWGRFADAIRTGQPAEPDFDMAVRRHKLLDAIERASDTGRRQKLAG